MKLSIYFHIGFEGHTRGMWNYAVPSLASLSLVTVILVLGYGRLYPTNIIFQSFLNIPHLLWTHQTSSYSSILTLCYKYVWLNQQPIVVWKLQEQYYSPILKDIPGILDYDWYCDLVTTVGLKLSLRKFNMLYFWCKLKTPVLGIWLGPIVISPGEGSPVYTPKTEHPEKIKGFFRRNWNYFKNFKNQNIFKVDLLLRMPRVESTPQKYTLVIFEFWTHPKLTLIFWCN